MKPMFMVAMACGNLGGGNRSASSEKVAGPFPAPPTPPMKRTTSSAPAVATSALPMLQQPRMSRPIPMISVRLYLSASGLITRLAKASVNWPARPKMNATCWSENCMSCLIGSSMSATRKPLPNSVKTVSPKIATAYQDFAGLGHGSLNDKAVVPVEPAACASDMDFNPQPHRSENAAVLVCARNRVFFRRRCAPAPIAHIRTFNFSRSALAANLHAVRHQSRRAAQRDYGECSDRSDRSREPPPTAQRLRRGGFHRSHGT